MNFKKQLPAMISFLQQLVETESPTNDKKAVDRVGAILAEESQNLGAKLTFHPQEKHGDHIVAKWGEGENGILLLGHMDTVFPVGTLETMPLYGKDDKVFGPGVFDMKGGLVITLSAIGALREAGEMPDCPVTILFTSDEETGSAVSRTLIEEMARQAKLVLVLEPALHDGSLKTWRKGVGNFILRAHGHASHAGGAHAKGRNAIEEMAHQILKIQKLTDYKKGTTLSIGTIKGGTASNVIPDFAEIDIDLRITGADEYERIATAINDLRPVLDGTSLEVTGELNRPPMPFDAAMEATFSKTKAIAEKVGITIKAGGSGGGSDGNFIAPLGISVLDGLGASGEGAHSSREYIHKESLAEKAQLVAALIRDW